MARTYLDYAAAAPVTPSVLRVFVRASAQDANPSSVHEEGRRARTLLEQARTSLASMAGVKRDEVLFVSGATEANALAILGHVYARLAAGTPANELHLLYPEGVHASLEGPMLRAKELGVVVEALPLIDGVVTPETLRAKVRETTTLVALEAASSETGARTDTRALAQVLRKEREGGASQITLHVDAVQLPLVESCERTRLLATTVALDAQKVGGIRGIGVLIAPRSTPLRALSEGGGQERGLSSGTKSPALAAALAAALEECKQEHERFAARAQKMRATLIQTLTKEVPNLYVNEGKHNLPHILNVSLPGRDTDYLVMLLDRDGFAVSTRSACDAESEQGSRAVFAATGDRERALSTLRISWGPKTSARALSRCADSLIRNVRFLDQHQP